MTTQDDPVPNGATADGEKQQVNGNGSKTTPDEQLLSWVTAQIQGYRSDTSQMRAGPDFYDRRVTCTACRHLGPRNICNNHLHAGLTTRELAAEFTHMRQHCPGFVQP